ncbi:MAG: biotin--[acetyl-CoA-carboxylase] ligase [Pseudomonadota bacterium]
MDLSAPIYWYSEIDSTSEEAKRRARSGETGPVWIAARRQTAGRGRLGRKWSSPDGNVFATFLFAPEGGLAQASRVPFAAGLAVVDAFRTLLPDTNFRLKWPNDVRVDQAKLTGVLVESGETNGVVWVALGIGINVALAPEVEGQATTSLYDLGAHPALKADDVLESLRDTIAARIKQSLTAFPALLEDWKRAAEGLGDIVEAGPIDARVSGVFEDLEEDGGLILRLPDGSRQTIRAGDVDLVRAVS